MMAPMAAEDYLLHCWAMAGGGFCFSFLELSVSVSVSDSGKVSNWSPSTYTLADRLRLLPGFPRNKETPAPHDSPLSLVPAVLVTN
jgi:hypothetical protein